MLNLKVTDRVPAHLDIFCDQLQNERGKDVSSENVELENIELPDKRKLDWRQALAQLNFEDLKYVDNRAKYVGAGTDEVDALMEDAAYLQQRSKKCKKRKDIAKRFLSLEAHEVDVDESSDDEENFDAEENVSGESTTTKDEAVYGQMGGVAKPSRMEGNLGVPEETYVEIDKCILNMQSEKIVQELILECENGWQKERSESLDLEIESEKKFCEHETEENFLKRMDIYSQADPSSRSCAIRQFALYILQPKFRNSVILGMYSSGFDNHFVFSELVNMGVRVEPVYRGNKLITFKIPTLNIRFLDFFCFVPSSLKNLEKSFNLKTGSKGYFPHVLNHPKHYGLNLPHLPPKKFYEPELMKKDDLLKFETWYAENFNTRFKFAQEILTYCELDVKILLAASLTFVKETLIQQTEFNGVLRQLKPNGVIFEFENKIKLQPNLVHPFSKDVCTLSSYANILFRSYFLPENYLPIITHDVEDTYAARSSKEEIEYLSYYKATQSLQDLEFGNEFRGQRKFTVFCAESQKTYDFYVDGYSPSQKVNKRI